MQTTTSFRASLPASDSLQPLGPLQDLPGTWMGKGLNVVLLPDFADGQIFRAKINTTMETLNFNKIGAPIPNRGSVQNDIEFLGLHYLQQVNDLQDSSALHLEPGIWLNVPATANPAVEPTVVRMASIPHGDSVMAQGNFLTVAGGPLIADVDTTPLRGGVVIPATDPYLAPLKNAVLPPGITPAMVINPNLFLSQAIAHQNIKETVVMIIATTPPAAGAPPGGPTGSGILNTPFVTTNANAVRMNAIFWIEKVMGPDGKIFMQLQYTQTVILNFKGVDWPHISVATLIKR